MPRRLFLLIYVVAFAAVMTVLGWRFWGLRQEYKQLQQTEALAREKLAEREQALKENQRVLDRLRTDSAFVEMAIRRRLGYAKPGEVIFRFERAEDILLNPIPGDPFPR